MEPINKFQLDDECVLLTNALISEVAGGTADEGVDQHLQLWIKKSTLYAIFSHPETGETSSYLRVPLKGSLLETHVTDTNNKCFVVRVAGINSPFVFSKEKIGLFIEASTTIET